MLDTIVLTLSSDMFFVFDPDRFEPSARSILSRNVDFGARGYFTAKQNPTKNELLKGYYKPRLTLTNRFNHTGRREPSLKIELSLPKLLFGNNFDELRNEDFDDVTALLLDRLNEMGVRVFDSVLRNAPVSAIHYSKNIPLTDGTTPHYLISKIKEANMSLALDVNQTDYRNEGHSYKWHANAYELAFYDKLKDYEKAKKSEKRAIEKDNAVQFSLFENMEKKDMLEVLRVEIRLNKRFKIRQLLKKINSDVEPVYKKLFNSEIAKKILIYYLDELESKRLIFSDYKNSNPKSLLVDIKINNPELGPLKTMQIFGFAQALHHMTARELRSILGGCSQRSWYRLLAEVKKVKLVETQSPLWLIRRCLNNFEPFKLVDFKDKMLYNDK